MATNLESIKQELELSEKSLNVLKSAGMEVPSFIIERIEKLRKQLAGNSSEQLAKILNESVGVKLNDFANEGATKLRESIIAAIGTKTRVALTVETAEDGTKTLKFESASNGGGATGVSSGNAGGTKEGSKYNNYSVVVGDAAKGDYPSKTFSAQGNGGKQTLKFILNNGKNPMNLPATYGEGASANKTLETLSKNEVFKANFVLEMSKVEVTAEPAQPTAEADANAQGEGQE